MTAENEQTVLAKLKQLGYHPFFIAEEKGQAAGFRHLLGKITSQEINIFSRQLSDLLNSGLSLVKALSTIQAETNNTNLSSLIEDIQNYVEDGQPFSAALARHPRFFRPVYVSLVKAGEAGGMLDEVMIRLADLGDREDEIKGKIKSAAAYPILLAAVGLTTVFILLTFVIPRFVVMFQDIGQVLPLPTRLLIGVSSFLKKYWWLVLGVLLILILLTRRMKQTREGKLALDIFWLEIPVLGKLTLKIETARFCRTLGTLMENGVPIITALEIVRETITNQKIAVGLAQITEKVREGEKLAGLIKKSGLFPPTVSNLMTVGEEGGRLEKMLLKLADNFEREIERDMKTVTSLLEPSMILVMGSMVGFIVLAMLLPIFRMNLLIK